jgi:hypothetical protein
VLVVQWLDILRRRAPRKPARPLAQIMAQPVFRSRFWRRLPTA